MNSVAFISGITGIIANVVIYLQKNGKKMLLWKLISDLLWVTHYFTLSAYAGMAVAMVGVLRETVFLTQNKKGVSHKSLLLFVACACISAALTWKNIFTLLPATASVLSVVSFWKASPPLTRFLAYPISLCMLTYDIMCASYAGVANEILTLISSTAGIICYKNRTDNF